MIIINDVTERRENTNTHTHISNNSHPQRTLLAEKQREDESVQHRIWIKSLHEVFAHAYPCIQYILCLLWLCTGYDQIGRMAGIDQSKAYLLTINHVTLDCWKLHEISRKPWNIFSAEKNLIGIQLFSISLYLYLYPSISRSRILAGVPYIFECIFRRINYVASL